MKIIGYQIESRNGKHDVPDEFNSFEILSLQVVNAWFRDDLTRRLQWAIVPVCAGDIEEPSFIRSNN